MKKKVSIIITNHNYEKYISFAIDSALSQEWHDTEVLVIDDGSTDRSRDEIVRYGSRIKAIFQDNGKHTRAVNTGFAASTGEFLLFLDADDILYPNAISTALAIYSSGDAKLQFQLATIDQDGVDQNFNFPYFERGFSPSQVQEQAFATGWYPWTTSSGNLYSREYLNKIFPLDPNRIFRSPDSILNKLAPLFGPVRTLQQVLGAYRVHGRNSWASSSTDWTPMTAVKWLQLNNQMETIFLEHARQRNIPVRRPLVHPFQKLEYEIQVHRFLPHEHVVAQSLPATIVECFRWFCEARWETWLGRMARLGFLVFLAFAPKKLLKKILPKARGQKDRSRFWKLALGLTRGKK